MTDAGYSCGKHGIDGSYGKDTLAAVNQFKKDHGLKANGTVDSRTIKALNKETSGSYDMYLNSASSATRMQKPSAQPIKEYKGGNSIKTDDRGTESNYYTEHYSGVGAEHENALETNTGFVLTRPLLGLDFIIENPSAIIVPQKPANNSTGIANNNIITDNFTLVSPLPGIAVGAGVGTVEVAEAGAAAIEGSGLGSMIFGVLSKVIIPVGIIIACDHITTVHTSPGELSEEERSNKGAENTDSEVLTGQAGRGQSKGGKHVPENLKEQLGMEDVISNPENGMELEGRNNDKRWPKEEGWEKWVQNVNGVEIHYEYNPSTGEVDDVKIK